MQANDLQTIQQMTDFLSEGCRALEFRSAKLKSVLPAEKNHDNCMNDKGMIAPYLASSLVNLFKPENKSQFRLRKDVNSTKMNDFLIQGKNTS